jgi:acetate kinase
VSRDPILCVNAGSHSLKLTVVDTDDRVVAENTVESGPDTDEAGTALEKFIHDAPPLAAVGHRIVHGGPELVDHLVIDDGVRGELERAASLAPLHTRPALAAVDRCRESLPRLPHVACLDTVFHRDLPEVARTYAVPREWREQWGIRRYGFHGLSYSWALGRAAQLLETTPSEVQLVIAHLGSGASVCAVRNGRSAWTSMGFTPLEGLVMGSRSGTVDPGMLLWLQTEHDLSAHEVSSALEHESGLLGLSNGRSSDTRVLTDAAEAGDSASRLALDVFCFRAAQEIAAAAACLDRLDAIVFTGEIGWDDASIRQRIVRRLGVLGIRGTLDARPLPDDRVLTSAGDAPVLAIRSREDLQMATIVRRLVG